MDSSLLTVSLFIAIVLVAVLIGHWIHATKFQFATEGSVGILLGVFVAGIYYLYYRWISDEDDPLPVRLVELNESLFFQVMLPPIIFYAGFSVKKKLFFQNLLTIVMFGVVGTLVEVAVIGAGASLALRPLLAASASHAGGRRVLLHTCIALGAIFSCSDTVSTLQLLDKARHPVLYSLVFGEGVINDAVAIVLLTAASHLEDADALGSLAADFLGLAWYSTLLGAACGLCSALVVRHMLRDAHQPDREVLVLLLSGLLAYALAGALQLSAILAVFVCGLSISHYTWHSLSAAGQMVATHSLRILAGLMETVLFVYSGLDMWYTALWRSELYTKVEMLRKVAALAATLLASIMAARLLVVLPGSWLANTLWRRKHKISAADALVLSWAGMARGAISLALTYHYFYRESTPDPHDQVIIAAAIVVVLLSTVALGALTRPLLDCLERRGGLVRASSELLADSLASAAMAPLPEAAAAQERGAQLRSGLSGVMTRPGSGSASAEVGRGGSSSRYNSMLAQPLLARPEPGDDFGPLLDAAVADMDAAAAAVEELRRQETDSTERLTLAVLWRRFDHLIMQPLFGGRTNPRGLRQLADES